VVITVLYVFLFSKLKPFKH